MKGKSRQAYIDLSQPSRTFWNLLACSRPFQKLVITSLAEMSICNTLKLLAVSGNFWNLLKPSGKFQNILNLVLTKQQAGQFQSLLVGSRSFQLVLEASLKILFQPGTITSLSVCLEVVNCQQLDLGTQLSCPGIPKLGSETVISSRYEAL